MQDDVTPLYPHPSASSNGDKEVQSSGRVNVFTSTLLMWVSSNVTKSAPDDPKLIPKWWRSTTCSLLIIPVPRVCVLIFFLFFRFVWFIYRTSDSEMKLFLSSSTLSLKSFLFLWHFGVFLEGEKRVAGIQKGWFILPLCWFTPSSTVLGRLWPRCLGLGQRGRKQCLEFVYKKKKKLESFPHVKCSLFPNELQWFF